MTHGLAIALLFVGLAGCNSASRLPMDTVPYVDLDRFMGDWYVIAAIPTPFEKDAFDAVETYARRDGYIATTFTYRRGGHDGPVRRMHPKGYVRDTTTQARWGMQFVWPFKADYRVIWLDADYTTTIVGREARDYVWIMARSPHMAPEVLERHRTWLASIGYDVSKLVVIPHRSPTLR
jgi:apolipoprotein D and lipocalin family protein